MRSWAAHSKRPLVFKNHTHLCRTGFSIEISFGMPAVHVRWRSSSIPPLRAAGDVRTTGMPFECSGGWLAKAVRFLPSCLSSLFSKALTNWTWEAMQAVTMCPLQAFLIVSCHFEYFSDATEISFLTQKTVPPSTPDTSPCWLGATRHDTMCVCENTSGSAGPVRVSFSVLRNSVWRFHQASPSNGVMV